MRGRRLTISLRITAKCELHYHSKRYFLSLTSFLVSAFNFNANHFTIGQLKKAKHIEDLPDTATTFAAVDGFVRGTGSGSCGPIPSKEYQIKFGYLSPLEYSFEVEPIK